MEPRAPKGERTAGLATAVLRSAALRCPDCGVRGLVRRWVRIRPACPSCGLRTDRGEHDRFLGAIALNLVAAELALPAAFYPFAKLLWLALTRRLRPEEPEERR